MTVHIALAGAETGVLISDSQGSTDDSKFGGWQKQFAAANCLIGVAGAGDVLEGLFTHLEVPSTSSLSIAQAIENYLNTEVVAAYRSAVRILMIESGHPLAARVYDPAKFLHFGPPSSFQSIGSGSDFVFDAGFGIGANQWRNYSPNTPAEQVAYGIYLADAADNSLTVNNSLMIGLLAQNRTYQLADEAIRPGHVDPQLAEFWPEVTSTSSHLIAMARAINGEIEQAYRLLSTIWRGGLSIDSAALTMQLNDEVKRGLQRLQDSLVEYCNWYDGILGR